MKELSSLSQFLAQSNNASASGVVLDPEPVKLRLAVTKVQVRGLVKAGPLTLKVARCLCSAAYQNVALDRWIIRNLRLLTLGIGYFENGTKVDVAMLVTTGLVRKIGYGVSFWVMETSLASWTSLHACSATAREKVVAAGGTVSVLTEETGA